jgi:hypothetical protein
MEYRVPNVMMEGVDANFSSIEKGCQSSLVH